MKYNPDIHHRRSIRLNRYDYSQAGAYFVTICTQNRESLFGDVVDGEMILNDAGRMVKKWFYKLGNKFLEIQPDVFICMPNHIHFILINTGIPRTVGADPRVCPDINTGEHTENMGEHTGNTGEHTGSPLHRVVRWYKTMTTNEYIHGVKNFGWQPFNNKLWQRNYYEHIICNDDELNQIRQYIINNPLNWKTDENYAD